MQFRNRGGRRAQRQHGTATGRSWGGHGLKVLVIGCGRDGTQSTTQLIRHLFAANGVEADVRHETQSVELYAGLHPYIAEGDDEALRQVMRAWTHDVEVSNGFAFCMPVVRSVFGPRLKIVHLRREREAHIRSLAKRPRVTPEDFGGYLDFAHEGPFRHVRPTAPDFGEMSVEQWQALSLEQRFGWYYDKSHELIEKHLHLFDDTLEVATESLSDPETIDRLRRFLDAGLEKTVPPVHLHSSGLADYEQRSTQELRVVEKMFNKFDLDAALSDELYPLRYFARYAMHHVGADPQRYTAQLRELRDEIDAFLRERDGSDDTNQ